MPSSAGQESMPSTFHGSKQGGFFGSFVAEARHSMDEFMKTTEGQPRKLKEEKPEKVEEEEEEKEEPQTNAYPNSPRIIMQRHNAGAVTSPRITKGAGKGGDKPEIWKSKTASKLEVPEQPPRFDANKAEDFFRWRDLIRENTRSKKDDDYPDWDTDALELENH